MKVAFASDNAYPWFNGGIEKRRFFIAQEFVKAGHEVHFFTMRHGDMKSDNFVKDKVHYHCTSNASDSEKLYVNGRRNIWWAFKSGTLLFFKMLPYKFDFMDVDAFPFFNVISADLYSKMTGTPLAITWYEAWSRKYWKTYLGDYKGGIGYSIESYAAKRSRKIIAISSATQDSLVQLFGIKRSNVQILPCAISSRELGAISKKRVKEANMFVIASRLVPEKRVDMAISAMKDLDAKLLVVGRGPELPKLKKLAKSLHIENKIIFKERLSRNQLFQTIRSSKGLVFPSEREGLSIITLESIALGTPVFIVKTTMLPKEVRKYCFETDDQKLSDLLKRAATSNEFKKKTLANRKNVMREFSSSATIPAYEKVLGMKLRQCYPS